MVRMMVEQFLQLASSRKPGTFSNQPEVNPKDLVASSSSGPFSSKNMKNINAIISFRLHREIDNQVKNSKEPCKFSQSLFQDSSPSSPLETGSFSSSGDTTNGGPSNS